MADRHRRGLNELTLQIFFDPNQVLVTEPRGSDEPEKVVALRRSINDRELIRELRQGQRL